MDIKLNGKIKKIKNNYTIIKLLNELAINPAGVVVEVNLNMIKREKWLDFTLKNGDAVEIITFMGGG